MLYIIFLIPLLFCVFLVIFFRKRVVLWEYIVLVLPSILVSSLLYFGMISSSETDTEYLGEYVTEIRYYEPWNEWITQTCTSTTTDADGNTVTTTYDCSYCSEHSENWTQVTSNGKELNISEIEYNRLNRLWKTQNSEVELNRSYYTKDGDMFVKNYDGNWVNSKTLTFTHQYKNKIKTSKSIFGFTKIDSKKAKKMGLYDYPKLINSNKSFFASRDENQNPIIGIAPNKIELTKWQYINGFYGKEKQFRTFLLVYNNQPRSIVQDQRDYWEGGNKNEFIMCVGLDSTTNTVQWYDAFSWSDRPTFEVAFRDYMSDKDTLNILELGEFVENSLSKNWVRKEFKDFEYIRVELTSGQLIILFLSTLLLNIGITIYIVNNGEDN